MMTNESAILGLLAKQEQQIASLLDVIAALRGELQALRDADSDAS